MPAPSHQPSSTGRGQPSWRPPAGTLLLVASILAIAALLSACHLARPDNQAFIVPVVGLLSDGNGPDGPHQRFRVDLGQTVVVEVDHNLTLAPRVPVAVGSIVIVHGQFEPDPGRPVVHYTHHRTGAHEGGWIQLNDHRYQ
jgi:hypothetical protein